MPDIEKNIKQKDPLLNLNFPHISVQPIARLKLNEWIIIISCLIYTGILFFNNDSVFLIIAVVGIMMFELYVALKDKKYFIKQLSGYQDGSVELMLLRWNRIHIQGIFKTNDIKIEVEEIIKYRSTRKIVSLTIESKKYELKADAFLKAHHINEIENYLSKEDG